jgi:prepilin-type N-terminal cleavage/methylation domain-containing protein
MKNNSSGGFTLPEVIIGMFILSIVLLTMNIGLSSFIKSNVSSKELLAATSIGNQLLEQMRLKPYNQIIASSDLVGSKYYRCWTVNTDSEKKTIALSVSWPQSTGSHHIELTTIISKP